jgi:DNA-binding HxlR family transcriptional regulator
MCEDTHEICLCPIEGVIDSISKKWALLIINIIGNKGRIRFTDLMKELNGISPKTLADTLKNLQEQQLIGREAFSEIPPRVEYYLTNDGKGLRKAVIPILKWAAKRDNHTQEKCISVCKRTTCSGKKRSCNHKIK